jgi:hypothetical protein
MVYTFCQNALRLPTREDKNRRFLEWCVGVTLDVKTVQCT